MERILIIDDTMEHRLIFSTVLAEAGYDVVVAEGGEEGLTQYARACNEDKRFSLIILDMGMPFMNGYEVADRIRGQGDNETPILFLSAHFEGRTERMNEYSPCLFLAKPPFNHDLVEAAIEARGTAAAYNRRATD